MSKMVSPLLMSVISQGPPALHAGQSSKLVSDNINLNVNRVKANTELMNERVTTLRLSKQTLHWRGSDITVFSVQ